MPSGRANKMYVEERKNINSYAIVSITDYVITTLNASHEPREQWSRFETPQFDDVGGARARASLMFLTTKGKN